MVRRKKKVWKIEMKGFKRKEKKKLIRTLFLSKKRQELEKERKNRE